jgi:exosome complex RNA-binding protein Rrp42 (RNase PH superfamily)
MQSVDPVSLTSHVASELKRGRRVPVERGRFQDVQSASIERDIVFGALSSALVRLGSSAVVASVTAQVGPTAKDQPDHGFVDFVVSTSGLAEPLGPSTREAQQTRGRVVGQFVSHAFADALDLTQLVIRSGEVCWVLKVDLRIVELDGDATEICVLAAAVVLKALSIPASIIADGSETTPVTLRLVRTPMAVTAGVAAGGAVVISPTLFELLATDALVRVAVDATATPMGVLTMDVTGRYPIDRAMRHVVTSAALRAATERVQLLS